MARMFLVVWLVSMAVAASVAQQSPPTSGEEAASFDAVSIKPNTSRISNAIPPSRGNGNYSASNIGLKSLIAYAYGVRTFQIEGGPAWLASERFDIIARGAEGTPDRLRASMLRTMLAERFKLVTHAEAREQQVYALTRLRTDGGLGPQLKAAAAVSGASADSPAAFPSSWVDNGVATIRGSRMSMDTLAIMLTDVAFNQRVLNRTDLEGEFQVELRFTHELSADVTSEFPAVFTAVREQLGLELEAARGLVDVLVIDSVERPTPN